MKKSLKAGAILFLITASPLARAAEPSFDCAKASESVEFTICKSDKLSRMDLKLSRLYKNIMERLPEDVKKEVRNEQLDWLKHRNKRCDLTGKKAEKCLAASYRKRNAALAAMLAFESNGNPSNDELKVLRISPKGRSVPAGRQIVFQFDRPVVPIGRMGRDSKEIPVTIIPKLNCRWRWLNTSALACQLREEDRMKQATRYIVKMKPGIRTVRGDRLKEALGHTFTTARPKITYTRFVNWLSPAMPLLQLTFNQPVTKSSVEKSLFMKATGPGDGRAVPLNAYPDDRDRDFPWWMAIHDEKEKTRVCDQFTKTGNDEARRVWIVKPAQDLPSGAAIGLFVQPGLQSSEGPVTGSESRTVLDFETYPEFRFVGIRCTLKGEERPKTIPWKGLKEPGRAATSKCAPLSPVALVFSSPVLTSMVRDHVRFSPGLDGGRKEYDPWENKQDRTRLTRPHRTGREYQTWLPELLQANREYHVNIDTGQFSDEFGRKLEEKTDFTFFTSHRKPDIKLIHNVAVLEKNVASDVPLYVNNLDNVTIAYDVLKDKHSAKQLRKRTPVPNVEDVTYAFPMGVRQLLGDDTGILFARLHPDPKPPGWNPRYGPKLLAQVTPFQVHLKIGHFNAKAWVTRFDTGEPVENAKVALFKGSYETLTELEDMNIVAMTDKDGLASLPGLAEFDPDLKSIRGYGGNHRKFFAKVEHDGDIAVIPMDWNFAVQGSGVYPRLKKKDGHSHAWGTTAQGIYKSGDTVQYKIYVRKQSNRHWVSPEKKRYTLTVFNPKNKPVFVKRDIVLNDFGAFDGEFKVPEKGVTGWHTFKLMHGKDAKNKKPRLTWSPMSVLVSDFTPAPFKVKAELNGERFGPNDQVVATAMAALHSGGPFPDAAVRLTAKLKQKGFKTDNPLAAGFTFGSSSGKHLDTTQQNLLDVRGNLDDFGQYEDTFTLPDTEIYYGSVSVESSVMDARGKFVAASAQADYVGRNLFVGLKNTKWLYKKGQPARIEALVVDQNGDLVPGADIVIAVNRKEYKASRVKGPGNAYLTRNIMQWVEESTVTIKSSTKISVGEFVPKNPGYYQFVATVRDDKGREHKSIIHGWVAGRGSVVWDQSNDATLQIIAEKKDYKTGDIARYLIKNPFPGAKALVTVERYGILHSWIETLETSTPVIEVPIKEDYLPGFYLSVVALSPRLDKPLGPGNLDLGKPSYRMGYVKTKVADPGKVIKVSIATNKGVYRPGEKVRVKIKVGDGHGKKREPYEIAVAVVDESVLALNRRGKSYYDPYAGFNRLDPLDVKNFNLVSRLVGRQKFEKKGANPGGGGAMSLKLRSLFKFVAYWNPSILPDENGSAGVEFNVPDNLTGWRVFAFAVSHDDRMGLGSRNFKVNRPTEIRPIMPNQVVEGDRFRAGFSLFNRKNSLRHMDVAVRVEGPVRKGSETAATYKLTVAPYKRKRVWLPVETRGDGLLTFTAQGGDRLDRDAVMHQVPVKKRRSLETASTYGTVLSGRASEIVKVPEAIHTDVGTIDAVLSSTVIGNIGGAFEYVRNFSHRCWEQQLTKAVVANAYIELKEYLDKTVQWPEPKKDVENVLNHAANFQAANGGMAYWIPANRHVSPYLSAYTAMAFHWLQRSGHEIPEPVESGLHDYLLTLLRKDTFPSFYNKGMSSSVRAVALAALAEYGKISNGDIARYASHVSEMDLFGKAHFLQAAIKTKNVSAKTIQDVIDAILGHASQTGGKFQFNETWDDSYKYILATPLRSNCSLLSSFLVAQKELKEGGKIDDIPFKLVRSINQGRGTRDHWENTQENVFCLNALIDYSKMYETEPPRMKASVLFDGALIGERGFEKRSDPMVTIGRPINDKDPGRTGKIEIVKEGQGRLYYAARIAYGLKDENAARIHSGIEARREYSVEKNGEFVLLKSPMAIKRGDIVKVDLFVSTPTARHFVVVNDPIPGGLEPVNTDLATASTADAEKGGFKAADGSWFYSLSNWSYYGRYFWSFYHKELRHDSAKFYADYLPAGNYHLSYTAQAIAEGEFAVMPVLAEEMYDPDVYGKGLPATLNVGDEIF